MRLTTLAGPLAGALFLSATLSAQTAIVSPKHWAKTDANAMDGGLISSTNPSRWLQVHDELNGQARKITGMALRPDGQYKYGTGALRLICDVTLSTALTTSSSISSTFAKNHGTDKVKVAATKFVSWPAVRPGLAQDFVCRIPFGKPFLFAGKGPLCVDLEISSRTNTWTVPLDLVNQYRRLGNSNPRANVRSIGVGCKTKAGTTLGLSCVATQAWTTKQITLNYTASGLPKNALALLVVGFSDTSMAGIPLPLLIPGSGSKAPSGSCYIYNDMFFNFPMLTSASGAANIGGTFAVQEAAHNGLVAYAQAMGFDDKANSFGLVTSQGFEVQIVAPYKTPTVGCVYTIGSIGSVGTRYNDRGLVTQIF